MIIMKYRYENAILGGTFDHFHKGHMHFLDEAFRESKSITIGLTTTRLLKDKILSNSIQEFRMREYSLNKFLHDRGYFKRAKIVPLTDKYGNSLVERKIDVIFITKVGYSNDKIINKERELLKFHRIRIVKVPLTKGSDGKVISSTRIRIGEIDRGGNTYLEIFRRVRELVLRSYERESLKKRIGKIIKKIDSKEILDPSNFIITIGDVVTSTLVKLGRVPDISVYDLKNKREIITDREILDYIPKYNSILRNKSGIISSSTVISMLFESTTTASSSFFIKKNQ